MAKKNLKRGLALGALMAFVITGSAMAADVIYGDSTPLVGNGNNLIIEASNEGFNGIFVNDEHKEFTGWKDVTITGTWSSSVIQADYYNLKFSGINSLVTADSSNILIPIIYSDNAKISIDAVDKVFLKNNDESGGNDALGNGTLNAYTGDITITAKSITVENQNGTAIGASSDTDGEGASAGKVSLNGDTIVIKGSGSSIYNPVMFTLDCVGSRTVPVYPTSEINLKGKYVNLEATQGEKIAITTLGGIVRIGQNKNEGFVKADIVGDIFSTYNELGSFYQDIYSSIKNEENPNPTIDNVIETIKREDDSFASLSAESFVTNNMIDINLGEGGSFNGAILKDDDLPGFKDSLNSVVNLKLGNGSVWNLTKASTLTEATFGAGSSLVIDGRAFTGEAADYAITGKVSMDPTANLVINYSAPDTNYKVVKGENNISDSNLSYDRTALVAVEKTGNVYEVEFKAVDKASPDELASAQNKAVAATGGDALAAPSIITGAIGPDAPAAAKELVNAITSSGASIDQKAAMVNAVAKIGEASGTTANAASVVNNVTNITTQRMSFTNLSTTPQGGHGKVERKYKSGAGVWAQYVHGKDKVEDMPSAGGANSYDSQYNGAVIGYDFKEVGKTHTGISFNYGEGDSHSKNSIASTRNDFDFWGVGLYTSIMNDDTNLIFDVNYNKSDADVKQNLGAGIPEVTVNPNTTSFSVGVKAEKLIQNGPVQIVPYAGARFLTIDTDEYTSSAGTVYAPERQNIWLIPVGVSLRQENVYENGWKVTPKADLSYIWALGDTDSSMTVTTGAASDPIAYTVMDNGSFLGTLGIEAEKGDWTYGLSYSYQKGEYQRSDKWFVDVRYSF